MESQICRNSSNPLSAAPLNFSKHGLMSGEEKQNIFTLESFSFSDYFIQCGERYARCDWSLPTIY